VSLEGCDYLGLTQRHRQTVP